MNDVARIFDRFVGWVRSSLFRFHCHSDAGTSKTNYRHLLLVFHNKHFIWLGSSSSSLKKKRKQIKFISIFHCFCHWFNNKQRSNHRKPKSILCNETNLNTEYYFWFVDPLVASLSEQQPNTAKRKLPSLDNVGSIKMEFARSKFHSNHYKCPFFKEL